MRVSGEYFCNVCRAEITDEEETNEFTTKLLDQKGHCHSECLTQRNAVIQQFDETFAALFALLDPGIESAPKIHQSVFVEGKRARPLKRAAKRVRVTGGSTFITIPEEPIVP